MLRFNLTLGEEEMARIWSKALGFVLLASLAIVGCGDDDDGTAGANGTNAVPNRCAEVCARLGECAAADSAGFESAQCISACESDLAAQPELNAAVYVCFDTHLAGDACNMDEFIECAEAAGLGEDDDDHDHDHDGDDHDGDDHDGDDHDGDDHDGDDHDGEVPNRCAEVCAGMAECALDGEEPDVSECVAECEADLMIRPEVNAAVYACFDESLAGGACNLSEFFECAEAAGIGG